ncbi:MAG: SCO family protein [Myxococcota bacterium]
MKPSPAAVALAIGWLCAPVARAEPAPVPDHCKTPPTPSPFVRTEAAYDLPDLTLVDQAGRPVRLRELAASDRPIALNFIFATCTTICPVMTATFAQLRTELGPDVDRVRFVSITIDPEHDTPAVLAAYADKFDAPADWSFLTGPSADIEQALRAFDAYTGSKLAHRPITLVSEPGRNRWVRLEGLGSGKALADEVRTVLASPR